MFEILIAVGILGALGLALPFVQIKLDEHFQNLFLHNVQ